MLLLSLLSYVHFEIHDILWNLNLSLTFISFSTDSILFQKSKTEWAQHAQRQVPIRPELDYKEEVLPLCVQL